MLLTATPEQMGVKNHFLHLQLLDPERYFNFNTYLDETDQYKKTLQTVKELIKKRKNTDHILDSYGPGRVIFRNKRNVIKGFPKRVPHLKPLVATTFQIKAINREFFDTEDLSEERFTRMIVMPDETILSLSANKKMSDEKLQELVESLIEIKAN